MIVTTEEVGNRPLLLTKARQFAPQAMEALAKYVSTQDWAEKASILLDWDNSSGNLPQELSYPVLYLSVWKHEPVGNRWVRVDERWDIDDIFGTDSMTPTILVDLVQEVREYAEDQIRRAQA